VSVSLKDLSKRERQVMAALYQGAPASVGDLLDRMTDPPTYSAVRAALRVLEEKGWVVHQIDGRRYLYKPKVDTARARKAALTELVRTFFDGSAETAAAALLGMSEPGVTADTVARLKSQVERARKEGR
jgi:BlaI family penicillinase repressor